MRRVAPLSMMAASGFAGLGYQIIWTQQCSLWLGHESAAVLAVVAAFFGGLALGGLLLGARIERSRHPAYWVTGSSCRAVEKAAFFTNTVTAVVASNSCSFVMPSCFSASARWLTE